MIVSHKRTKIIATIGPASSSLDTMLDLIKAGVDVFRVNLSHGNYDSHLEVIEQIHEINKTHKLNIGILIDLQGPKIRVGNVENDVLILENDQIINITTKEQLSNSDTLFINYNELATDAKVGDAILIDDGNIELKVIETNPGSQSLKAEVIFGGEVSSKKGVNLPNTELTVPSLTEKDKKDLEFALKHRPSWIALSFVRKPEDILELKKLIDADNTIKVIAKIEKPEAVKLIDEIIAVSDGIMIARGDLGVEVPMERMPIIQKNIVKKCVLASKPVIVATQILDSMIHNARPTRAEINDVANDMMDGADALMLSGETATGIHPVKVIETLTTIMYAVEEQEVLYNRHHLPKKESPTFLFDAMCYSACQLSENINADAIIGMTRSGYTAFMVSSYRPMAKIIIFTNNEDLLNILSLSWGVQAFYYDKFVSTDETIHDVIEIMKKKQIVKENDVVINTGTMPLMHRGKTNMVKITVVS